MRFIPDPSWGSTPFIIIRVLRNICTSMHRYGCLLQSRTQQQNQDFSAIICHLGQNGYKFFCHPVNWAKMSKVMPIFNSLVGCVFSINVVRKCMVSILHGPFLRVTANCKCPRRCVWLASAAAAAAAAAAGGGVCWQIFCMRAAGGRLLEPGSWSLGWEYRILSQNIVMTLARWPEQARQPRRLKQWSDAGGSAGEHWPAHYCDQRIPATLATKQGDQTFQYKKLNGKWQI